MTRAPGRSYMKPEDSQRMLRLTEEVRSRLFEMALIAARTAGEELPTGAVLKFVPTETIMNADTVWMEIIDNPGGSHTCVGQETNGAGNIFVEAC